MSKTRRILALDGGGMRGLIPAMTLANWEQKTNKTIASQVDMIYGVSIGGILATIIGAGLPASQAVEFFTIDGPKIFTGRWGSCWGLFGPKYSGTVLESVLRARLDTRRMLDCKTNVGTYALDVKSGDPVFFKSYDPESSTAFEWQASRATSAAQTYFPSFIFGRAECWDGGNLNNNPSLIAYAEAKHIWPDDEIKVLSLGCGMDNGDVVKAPAQYAGAIRAGIATISLLFEADSAETDYTIRQFIGSNYLRIQPVLPRAMALDDASAQGLSWLNESGQQAIRSTAAMLDSFLA
jgi:patatin-like phospholipase/acyl hydrolase